jgi:hypothetical protein
MSSGDNSLTDLFKQSLSVAAEIKVVKNQLPIRNIAPINKILNFIYIIITMNGKIIVV